MQFRITDIEFDFEDSQGELPMMSKLPSLMMLCQSPGMLLTMKIS